MFRTTLLKLFLLIPLLIPGVCSERRSSLPGTLHKPSGNGDHTEQSAATKDAQQKLKARKRVLVVDINNNNDNKDVLYLTFKFSVWYPALQGRVTSTPFDTASERFVAAVLGVLRDFLCQDSMNRKILVVHALNHTQSQCRDVDVEGYEKELVENDLNAFHAINATILSQKKNVQTKVTTSVIVVMDRMEGGVEWMSWEVIYQVVRVGKPFWELSSSSGAVVLTPGLLQESVQDTLNEKIRQGNLDERLQEYLVLESSEEAKLSLVGQELETFLDSSTLVLEGYFEFSEIAEILRWIGVGLIILVIWTCILLTAIARKRRLNLESKETEKEGVRQRRRQNHPRQQTRPKKSDELPHDTFMESKIFLNTEADVNRMLSMGQKVSSLRDHSRRSPLCSVECGISQTEIESGTARKVNESPIKASATLMTTESSPRSDDMTYDDSMESEIVFQRMENDVNHIHSNGRKELMNKTGGSSLFLKPFVDGLNITDEL